MPKTWPACIIKLPEEWSYQDYLDAKYVRPAVKEKKGRGKELELIIKIQTYEALQLGNLNG